ncbi:hypothetical protein [Enterobacter cloacae]|uniref:hypothetical protein n=1 Tax=Enterobacter cloacae TaxID=550 RepID=UPI0039064E60
MDNTPGFSGKKPDGCTTRGGNYWMPITPETWKVLHAGLHFIIKNPWELPFFIRTDLEMYHIRKERLICPGTPRHSGMR